MKHHLIAAAILGGGLARAPALEFGAPFANPVLQHNESVPVWSWSEPGTEVTVEFARPKQSAKAAADGKWTITLSPLEVSADGRAMTIADNAGETRTLEDLLVGEVWMASDQSNMQWLAFKSSVQNLIKQLQEKGETSPIRAVRAVPDGKPWGSYPQLTGEVTSKASQTHNVHAASFIPGSFQGIIFLTVQGESRAIPITDWADPAPVLEAISR